MINKNKTIHGVKIFEQLRPMNLEDDINVWLEQNTDLNIVDIKIATSDFERHSNKTALVWYTRELPEPEVTPEGKKTKKKK